MTDIKKLQGDVQILALAVQALIETHPDKTAVHAAFKHLLDHSSENSLYSPTPVPAPKTTPYKEIWHASQKGFGVRVMSLKFDTFLSVVSSGRTKVGILQLFQSLVGSRLMR